jgi:hypothetical protein
MEEEIAKTLGAVMERLQGNEDPAHSQQVRDLCASTLEQLEEQERERARLSLALVRRLSAEHMAFLRGRTR